MEYKACAYKESVVDAEAEILECARSIASANKKVEPTSPLRPFFLKLYEMVKEKESGVD